AKLRLTPRAARLLRAKLKLRRLPPGALGVLALDANASRGGIGGGGTGGGGAGGGGGGAASCVPTPKAPPADPSTEPVPLARPEGAQAVASATLVWRPRDVWVRYVHGGNGTCVFGGATNGPKEAP